MKRNMLLLLLLCPLSFISGQEVFFGLQSGIGWYKMEELKYFNSGINKSSSIESRLIDDYPPYIYFQPYVSLNWERMEVGICYSFHSTGSRYSLQDYSGEYLFDTRISSEGPAILFNFRIIQLSSFRFLVYNEIGLQKTKMVLDESLYLGSDEVFDESYKFTSTDFYWEPGVKVGYPVASLLFEVNVGYVLQSDGDGLEFQGARNKGFLQVAGENVHAGWNGLRLGLTIAINLTRMKNGGSTDE